MIFSLLMMVFAVLISGLFLRDISKIILDLCLSAVNLGGLLVPFFLAINLLAKDIERKTIFSILSRPIARSQYILGKFGGLMMLTGAVMLLLTLSALVASWIGKWIYGEAFFTSFSISSTLVSVFIAYLGILVLNALVVLWCSVTTSSFLATLLTLFTYLIGQTIDDVVRFMTIQTQEPEFSETVRWAVNAAQYLFPNLAAFDFKFQAAHGLAIPFGDTAFLLVYATAYISSVLIGAILIFSRRDFA
jgi:ABC-type transport system involved in multi-copper enzyme maturation permease subunit